MKTSHRLTSSVINLETREIFVTNSTLHPDAVWLEQQTCNFLLCGEKHLNNLVREFVRYHNDNDNAPLSDRGF
ncbi:hypothetical protein [Symmachiella dynata]|uniref:hypothetical protein n=1 Tax=Symmachiella dynata TaxID=2527995 RepID=UPI0011AB23D5|nr:hypothetical protein [Symmachiella dynata]